MTIKETRAENIRYYQSSTTNPGAMGCAFELECTSPKSRKVSVSAQGAVDVHVKINVNGKTRYVPAECKTNGGRVDSLLNGKNKSKFVVYRLEFVQKHKATKKAEAWDEIRKVPAVIIPTELFVAMLRETGAVKEVRHAGQVDGLAIQPSSKKMYQRLMTYIENYGESVLFQVDKTWEAWEFEGLEL